MKPKTRSTPRYRKPVSNKMLAVLVVALLATGLAWAIFGIGLLPLMVGFVAGMIVYLVVSLK